MERLGTRYGGWILPKDIELNEDSVVYSAGVGEDISFDILLSDKYKCNIILIDPTKRAKKHYDEVVYYYEKIKWKKKTICVRMKSYRWSQKDMDTKKCILDVARLVWMDTG